MRLLYRYSIRHPRRVLALAGLITLAIAPGILRLELRTDGHALVPGHAPEIAVDQSIRDEFGVGDPIVVLIRSQHADGVFNAHTLALVQELTDAFKQLEGIRPADLFSLATEHSDRVRPGTLVFRRFLEPLPTTREELERLRNDLREIELYTGTLVSYDETMTTILVSIPHGANRSGLARAVRDVITAKGPLPEEIDIIGAPVAEALLGTHILEDLGVPAKLLGHQTFPSGQGDDQWHLPGSWYELRLFLSRHVGLVPLALSVMVLVFIVSFRSFVAAILPLTEVGACLIVVFALMGWCEVPVYLTIAVLPVILTAIGVADEIHIFRRYTDELRNQPSAISHQPSAVRDEPSAISPQPSAVREGNPRLEPIRNPQSTIRNREAVLTTMTEMSIPVVKTSLTTAVGFLSFALSPIGPVRAFGLFTAVGILFCMVWSLTVIPALLVLIEPGRFVSRRGGESSVVGPASQPVSDRLGSRSHNGPLFARLVTGVIRHRFVVLLLAVAVIAGSAIGVRRVVVQDSWISGFAPGSKFYEATHRFNEQFLGTHILLVCVDTGDRVLSGTLSGREVRHREIRFPASLVSEPKELVGQRMVLRLVGDPSPDKSPPTGRGTRRPRRATVWSTRIACVSSEDDAIVVQTSHKRGSPRLSMRLSDEDALTYEITPQRLMPPEVLERIGRLEDFLEAHRADAVGGVIGLADYIETTNFMARGRAEGSRRIPPDADRIAWLWKQYERVRGRDRLRQVIDAHFSRGLITVFLKDANFLATQRLLDDLRAYEEAELAPHGFSLTLAGDVAVSQTLIKAIVSTQITSLLVSLVGIVAITALLARSLGWGLYSVLPCAVAVLINFAVMGWIHMPLGVATSMFAGMTLGIGVDYTIHFLERFRLARARGLDREAALIDTATTTGPAIFIDALGVALGFGMLMISQVPANARLGGLVVLSIVSCFAATLVLLPALVRICEPRGAKREV